VSSFVVIGGGVAGLVAARLLAKAGHSVDLHEATERLGGTVASHTVGGLVLDAGAESFATRGGTVDALATTLGLGLDVVTPAPAGAWLQRGTQAWPLPATSILGIPGVPLAADVIAVIGQRAALRAFVGDALLPGTYGSRARTLGELVRKRMGSAVLEQLVTPITYGVHSVHPNDLPIDRAAPGLIHNLLRENSLARAVQTMRAAAPAGSQVAGIVGGVHRLVTELAADLVTYGVTVHLSSTVQPEEFPDATVVMTAPSKVQSTVTLATLVVDVPALAAAPRGSGVLVASPTSAKALTHATAKWPWLAERAGGKHVIRLSYAGDGDVNSETARTDATALLGIDVPAASVIDFATVRWSRPAPFDAPDDGVTYIGEGVAGSGLANVVRQATAAAEALLELADQDEPAAEAE
jgi:oxygen-dependent protoporphyrinogen oxidase